MNKTTLYLLVLFWNFIFLTFISAQFFRVMYKYISFPLKWNIVIVIVLMYIVFTKGFSFVAALYHNTTSSLSFSIRHNSCQSLSILHDHPENCPWNRAWFFNWSNVNTFHPRMRVPSLLAIGPVVLSNFIKFCQCIFIISILLTISLGQGRKWKKFTTVMTTTTTTRDTDKLLPEKLIRTFSLGELNKFSNCVNFFKVRCQRPHYVKVKVNQTCFTMILRSAKASFTWRK